jgi:hypothetical protein
MLYLFYKRGEWSGYILSAENLLSGRLGSFGVGLEAVYVIWILVVVTLYPLCGWYQRVKQNNPSRWWLSYL